MFNVFSLLKFNLSYKKRSRLKNRLRNIDLLYFLYIYINTAIIFLCISN